MGIIVRTRFVKLELVAVDLDLNQTVWEPAKGVMTLNSAMAVCKEGKIGVGTKRFFLAKQVASEFLPTEDVERVIDDFGFVSAGLSELFVLSGHVKELYEAGIYRVVSLDENSRWQKNDEVCCGGLVFDASHCLLVQCLLCQGWNNNDWFLVRRKD